MLINMGSKGRGKLLFDPRNRNINPKERGTSV